MTEEIETKPKLEPEVAILYIDQALTIVEDKGKSVFGWEVKDPLRSAFQRLDEASYSLDGVEGAENQLARAYEVYGDIASRDETMQNPKAVAEEAYAKAIQVLKKNKNFDAIAKITPKLVKLGGKTK